MSSTTTRTKSRTLSAPIVWLIGVAVAVGVVGGLVTARGINWLLTPGLDRGAFVEEARTALLNGELSRAEDLVSHGLAATPTSDQSDVAWKLRLLEPDLRIDQQAIDRASALLDAVPEHGVPGWVTARATYLRAKVSRDRGDLERAAALARDARAQAADDETRLSSEWLEGQVLLRLKRWENGQALLRRVVASATTSETRPVLAQALNDLGMLAYRQQRYDQALPWFDRVLALDGLANAAIRATALSNAGICYSRLGMLDRAVALQEQAIAFHRQRGASRYLADALRGLGNTYQLKDEPERAVPLLREAFEIGQRLQLRNEAYLAAVNLASVSQQLHQWEALATYEREATTLRGSEHDSAEATRLLVAGQVARERGQLDEAKALLQKALAMPEASLAVRWSSQAALTELAMDAGDAPRAARHFEAALGEIEKARKDLSQVEFKLSFLPDQVDFYRAYVDFLVTQGRDADALEVADSFRSRILTEGHRVGPLETVRASTLQQVARRTHTTILSFWLAPSRSFLWVVDGRGIRRVNLPPLEVVEEAVREYRAATDSTTADPLASTNPASTASTAGDRLFQMLLASATVPADASLVIVPDGALNSLNFETLPVDGPRRHYLIEDATIQVAPSLALLTAAPRAPRRPDERHVLLIGDALARMPEFPALTYAAAEMEHVTTHFSADHVTRYQRDHATPAVYREAPLDRFSIIHFTAHATANLESPLDSAVVLSGPDGEYKLYARDVAERRLTADLVTVSACRSAGERSYSGEGLVGFAWAFLRAGATRVVAGLWDVDDQSTADLMNDLYAGLQDGRTPAQALRAAKLAMIARTGRLSRPYYWGPFQVFTVTP